MWSSTQRSSIWLRWRLTLARISSGVIHSVRTIPVSSVRWEAARDGVEDAAALRMLEQAIAAARTKDAQSDVVKKAEATLRIVRTGVMEMADEAYVETRDFLKKGDREVWHTQWDAASYSRYRKMIAEATHAVMGVVKEEAPK